MNMSSLPIIDISPLYQDDQSSWQLVIEQIDHACRTWGFFYIKGHPITSARIHQVIDTAKAFFALPMSEKMKIDITQSKHHRGYGAIAAEQLDPNYPGDFKEAFDMGFHIPAEDPDVLAGKPLRGPNRHPDIPGWKALMEGHYQDMHQLGMMLLRAIALSLGAEKDFFDHKFEDPISAMRIIHYPPKPSTEDEIGAGVHTDYGCITLLYQDNVGGLQVKNLQGEWMDAPPVEGAFVVNIGDMMARWSNDRYKSTPHRVVSPKAVDRYSMPYFVEPNPDTLISCLPGCQDVSNPAKYPPIKASDYMLSRFADTYKYRKTV